MVSKRFKKQAREELSLLDGLAKHLLNNPEGDLDMRCPRGCIIGVLRQVTEKHLGKRISFCDAKPQAFPILYSKHDVNCLFKSHSYAYGDDISMQERNESRVIAAESIFRYIESGDPTKPSSNFKKPIVDMVSPITGEKYITNHSSKLSSIPEEMLKVSNVKEKKQVEVCNV